jgi:hypothetical protein
MEGDAGQEYAKKHLTQIAVDEDTWKVLYRNEGTGEYWKEYFPNSELQGGEPSRYIQISEGQTNAEFKF